MMSTALKLMHSRLISGEQAGAGIVPGLVAGHGQDCVGTSWLGFLAVAARDGEHLVMPMHTQGVHTERYEH